MRRKILGVVTTATLLATLALATPAQAAIVVKETLGRNVVVYTSYPNDPTPTSRWTASAQGESVDTNGNGIADSLRGRAAVLESHGIIRVRIHRVVKQAIIGGVWTTVQSNEADVVSEANPAYAVGYTTPNRYCATDPSLTRTYRDINPHAVRRVDNIVAERTTYSHNYVARALATDPACPETPPPPPPPPPATADLEIDVQGSTADLLRTQTRNISVAVVNNGPDSAGTVTAKVDFDDNLTVTVVDSRCVLDTSTATDTNDYTCNLGVFGDDEVLSPALAFTVRGDVVGAQSVEVSVAGSAAAADTDADVLNFNVIGSADLELGKTIDDTTPAVGSTVTYTLTVANSATSANNATNVRVTDDWPAELGDTVTVVAGGDAVCARDASTDTVTCSFGTVVIGSVEAVQVQTTISGTPDNTVTNTARVRADQGDPDDPTGDTASVNAVLTA